MIQFLWNYPTRNNILDRRDLALRIRHFTIHLYFHDKINNTLFHIYLSHVSHKLSLHPSKTKIHLIRYWDTVRDASLIREQCVSHTTTPLRKRQKRNPHNTHRVPGTSRKSDTGPYSAHSDPFRRPVGGGGRKVGGKWAAASSDMQMSREFAYFERVFRKINSYWDCSAAERR